MPLSKPFEVGDRVLLSPLMYPSIDFPVILLGTEQGCLKIGAGIHGILIVGPEYVIHAPPRAAKKKALSSALSISGFTPEQEELRYRERRDANLRGSVKSLDTGPHPLDTCQCGDYYKNHGRGTDPPHQFTLMEKHRPLGKFHVEPSPETKDLVFRSQPNPIPSAAFSFKEGKDGQIKTVIDYSKAVALGINPRTGDMVEVYTDYGWATSHVHHVSEFDFDASRAGDVPRFYRIQDHGKERIGGWRFPSTPPKRP